MISRHVDTNHIVTHLKREFAATEELFVLPSVYVGVGTHSREPLRDLIDVVSVVFEILVSSTASNHTRIVDVVVPVHIKDERLSVPQGFGQVDSHHRFDDGVF